INLNYDDTKIVYLIHYCKKKMKFFLGMGEHWKIRGCSRNSGHEKKLDFGAGWVDRRLFVPFGGPADGRAGSNGYRRRSGFVGSAAARTGCFRGFAKPCFFLG